MIIKPSSADSMTFSLRAINERLHYNRISLDLILRRPPSWRGRLEGWPRVIAVHPSFETPCCARLLRMRSDFPRAKSWRRNNANDTSEKVKKRIAASSGVLRGGEHEEASDWSGREHARGFLRVCAIHEPGRRAARPGPRCAGVVRRQGRTRQGRLRLHRGSGVGAERQGGLSAVHRHPG